MDSEPQGDFDRAEQAAFGLFGWGAFTSLRGLWRPLEVDLWSVLPSLILVVVALSVAFGLLRRWRRAGGRAAQVVLSAVGLAWLGLVCWRLFEVWDPLTALGLGFGALNLVTWIRSTAKLTPPPLGWDPPSDWRAALAARLAGQHRLFLATILSVHALLPEPSARIQDALWPSLVFGLQLVVALICAGVIWLGGALALNGFDLAALGLDPHEVLRDEERRAELEALEGGDS